MVAGSKSSQRDQASIKFRWVPIDAASIGLSDNHQEGNIHTLSNSNKQSSKHPKHGSPDPEILTTAQLVSAIGKVWDCANRPLPFFWPKATVEHTEPQTENVLLYNGFGRSKSAFAGFDGSRLDPNCAKHYYDMVNSSFECIEVTQKTSLLGFCRRLSKPFLFGRYVMFGDSSKSVESWKVDGLASLGIAFDFENNYERITKKKPHEPNYLKHMTLIECKKPGELRSDTVVADCADVGYTDYSTNRTKLEDSPLGKTLDPVESIKNSVTPLHFNHSLNPVTDTITAVSNTQTSDCHSDLQHMDKPVTRKGEDILHNENMFSTKESVLEDVLIKVHCSDKGKYPIPSHGHALAGALSGTFVSLCLHPVDTIKTVTQSQSMAEKSIFGVMRAIISDRGVTGLYRGIASNIASSAPISAVYTYTYESVKGALLPLLPNEYHSIAHCMAGGCASIATSFIFTPSERIKQQMQVGSHYQNSWAALVGILGRGGFSSLYAGWGAVLCRNIPHSIIKFYTYETLKQVFLSTTQSNARPSTHQTLICGGLAGCTAALFTTPFDVVKTRLQTQIPGCSIQYDGVFHALQEISKHEGLKGLYRGLTPRLIMYISQGALFFSSYEFFKGIFNLELRKVCAPDVQDKNYIEDESTSSVASLVTSSVPRLPSLQSELEAK